MSENQLTVIAGQGAVKEIAENFKLNAEVFLRTMQSVAMPAQHSMGELLSCLLVAHAHNLNPLTKEIYFMKTKSGKIQPIVSVDGWIRKCNEHPDFNGFEFEYDWASDSNGKRKPLGITVRIHLKSRERPVEIYEDLAECKAAGGPVWNTMQLRMLRNRGITQCARLAFGFSGVMAPDEFDDWQHGSVASSTTVPLTSTPVTFEDLMPELEKSAPEPENQDTEDDAPIADEAGFLDRIEDQLSGADGDPEVILEIEEANRALVKRMSKAGQEKAAQLYARAREKLERAA